MMDAETFLWYVDVIVREGLRQQREHLKQKGGMKDGVPEAELEAKIIVDEAPTHKAFKRGIRKRFGALGERVAYEDFMGATWVFCSWPTLRPDPQTGAIQRRRLHARGRWVLQRFEIPLR